MIEVSQGYEGDAELYHNWKTGKVEMIRPVAKHLTYKIIYSSEKEFYEGLNEIQSAIAEILQGQKE